MSQFFLHNRNSIPNQWGKKVLCVFFGGGGGCILVAEWDGGMGATNKKQNRKSTDKFIG